MIEKIDGTLTHYDRSSNLLTIRVGEGKDMTELTAPLSVVSNAACLKYYKDVGGMSAVIYKHGSKLVGISIVEHRPKVFED